MSYIHLINNFYHSYYLSFYFKMSNNLVNSSVQIKHKGDQPPNAIWEDINKEDSISYGKFATSCKYCNVSWPHGEVSRLEKHLLNHCQEALAEVIRKYMAKIMELQDKPKPLKKRKVSDSHQSTINGFWYLELLSIS